MATASEPLATKTFCAFNTVCSISLFDGDAQANEVLLESIEKQCAHYELIFSRFAPESQLYRLNHSNGEWMSIDTELARLLNSALAYCEATEGLFDITMGSACALWNFHEGIIPEDKAIAAALEHVNWRAVETRRTENGCEARLTDARAMVDLGGIAKGYIADAIGEQVRNAGVKSALINLGGNVLGVGEKPNGNPWKVGIRKPVLSGGTLETESFAAVAVRDKSVVTSGVYERAFLHDGRWYHHILDPKTGRPAETDLLSATLISEKSLDGDGFTTALIVMGYERALAFVEARPGLEAVFMRNDEKVFGTSGIGDTVAFHLL